MPLQKCGHSFFAHRLIVGALILVALACLLGGGFMLWQVYFPPAEFGRGPLLVEPFLFIRNTGFALVGFGFAVAIIAIVVARRLRARL